MDDKISKLVKEIAAKHNVALDRHDPILILQTLNEMLLRESQQIQQELLNTFRADVEEIVAR